VVLEPGQEMFATQVWNNKLEIRRDTSIRNDADLPITLFSLKRENDVIKLPDPEVHNEMVKLNVKPRTPSSLIMNVILRACYPGYLYTKIFIHNYHLSISDCFTTNRYLNRLSSQAIQFDYCSGCQ